MFLDGPHLTDAGLTDALKRENAGYRSGAFPEPQTRRFHRQKRSAGTRRNRVRTVTQRIRMNVA